MSGDSESVEAEEVICGETVAACVCGKAPHPADEPHVCRSEVCKGSWMYIDGQFEVIRMPGA